MLHITWNLGLFTFLVVSATYYQKGKNYILQESERKNDMEHEADLPVTTLIEETPQIPIKIQPSKKQ